VPSWPVTDQKQGRKPWPRRLAAGVGVVGGVPGTSHATKGTMTSDAIVLLKDDHKEIRRLFRDFQHAGDKATKKKARLVEQIIEQLAVHTYIENEVMYPEVRALLPELEDDMLESYEEHHVADVLCMELSAMAPDAEHSRGENSRGS
jgi:hypothetical protein